VRRVVSRADLPRFSLRENSSAAVADFSRSGDYLATTGPDYCLELWRLADGSQVNTQRMLINPAGLLRLTAGSVAAAFSPADEFTLAIAQEDGYATLWDVIPGRPPKLTASFPHSKQVVWSVAFSPDGEYLATGCDDGRARVWHTRTRRQVFELIHGTTPVHGIAFPSVELVVTGAKREGACAWWVGRPPAAGQPTRTMTRGGANTYPFVPLGGAVFGVAASRDRTLTRVLVGGSDAVQLWELSDAFHGVPPVWNPRDPWSGPAIPHASRVEAVAIAPDGRTCVSADHGGLVRLWDADSLSLVAQPIRHGSRVRSVRFSPDGQWLLVSGEDGVARVWAVPAREWVGTSLDHEGPSLLDAWFGSDGTVRTATVAGVLRWDGNPPRPTILWQRANSDWDRAIRFVTPSSDGETVFVGTFGSAEPRVCGPTRFGPAGVKLPAPSPVHAAAFSPDGRKIVTVYTNPAGKLPAVRLWDLSGDEPRHQPGWGDAAPRKPTCAVFSPDGQRILVGCADHKAVWLDGETGQVVGPAIATSAAVTAVAVRPDNLAAAIACRDGTIRVWQADRPDTSGAGMQTGGGVTALAYSPDGSLLATASDDRAVRFWNPESGMSVGPPMMHRGVVNRVRFAKDNRTILTASLDGKARTWSVPKPASVSNTTAILASIQDLTGLVLGDDDVLHTGKGE
jgi:WD40 repeat protein